MYLLSLDLSSATGTLALHLRGADALTLVKECDLGGTFTHSEKLLGRLEELLGEAGVPLAKVDSFVTSAGPGSFTGLRIAMSTLKAFCMALAKPLEVMSGSEARALAWAATQPVPLPWDEIFVFTHASMDRYVKATFHVEDATMVRLRGETLVTGFPTETDGAAVVLLDERTPVTAVPAANEIRVENFPLRARYLAETIERAATRRTLTTLEDWISLSPNYFGTTKF